VGQPRKTSLQITLPHRVLAALERRALAASIPVGRAAEELLDAALATARCRHRARPPASKPAPTMGDGT
jgi:hypothetical protein